jgi:hypothetical protein
MHSGYEMAMRMATLTVILMATPKENPTETLKATWMETEIWTLRATN